MLALPRALSIYVCLWILWATKTQAQKLTRSRNFKKYASGIITTPNVTFDVADGIIGCGVACAANTICMGFSVTPNQSASLADGPWSTCRLGFGTFQWEDDPTSSLLGVDIGPLNGYTLKKDGRFYKKYIERLSYKEALRACDADGAAAADSYGQQAFDIVYNLMQPDTNQIIQGMYRTSDYTSGRWITFRGIVFNATGDTNQFWDRPANEPLNGECVTTGPTTGQPQPLAWYAEDCGRGDQPLPRICQMPIGYERASNGKYYKMHYEKTLSHAQARAICQSEGGALANLLTQENFDAVEVYRIRAKFGAYDFKIDGTDEGHEGVWALQDGVSTLGTQDIPNWGQGEPNNWGGAEHCLGYFKDGMILYDMFCENYVSEGHANQRFLCEIIP